ncbi:MAG: hypothetical protein QOF58_1924 [Pseudonocardiales bacterium]|jgi:transcriptional regulator with XRE-family HTH domain|nr:hypothetical protein [Pseudonocardiales bacterium]
MSGKSTDQCPRFNPDGFRDLRRSRRLSRREFGARINRSRQAVLRWETGETSPSACALRAAAHILRVQPLELLYPTYGEPTLADLRMDRAFTPAELAVRSASNLDRLRYWERTGCLGAENDTALKLASYLGVSPLAVERYRLTGQVPEAITFRLSRVLHVEPEQVQAAFERTAALYAAADSRALRRAS